VIVTRKLEEDAVAKVLLAACYALRLEHTHRPTLVGQHGFGHDPLRNALRDRAKVAHELKDRAGLDQSLQRRRRLEHERRIKRRLPVKMPRETVHVLTQWPRL
jgi:hypothetical protein